ncbi:MAG: hypothetical protein H6Q37_236 [Chloroflexi bacterium]|nr:hypothetical protein [Chloroflexota bacterium]
MGIFKKLSGFFSTSGPQKAPDYSTNISVKCNRCGEIIRARIDLRNDLTINYDNNTTYYCRKVIIGEQRCYQKIEVELTFDARKKLISRLISGGEFVDES